MGFKLKWFRHRLTFDNLPTYPSGSSSSPSPGLGRFRRSRSEAVIVTGYYRRSVDEDAPVEDHNRPKELPPIKARTRSQNAITPIHSAPSMPSLTETSPIQVKKVHETTITHPEPAAPIHFQKVAEKKKVIPEPVVSAPPKREEQTRAIPEPIPPKRQAKINSIPEPAAAPQETIIRPPPRRAIYNEPPPSYTKEDTNKSSTSDKKIAERKPKANAPEIKEIPQQMITKVIEDHSPQQNGTTSFAPVEPIPRIVSSKEKMQNKSETFPVPVEPPLRTVRVPSKDEFPHRSAVKLKDELQNYSAMSSAPVEPLPRVAVPPKDELQNKSVIVLALEESSPRMVASPKDELSNPPTISSPSVEPLPRMVVPTKDDLQNQSTIFRSKMAESQRSPPVSRPKTFPASLEESSTDFLDNPPPLPTSAPPIEDPKPWFEIEEVVIDEIVLPPIPTITANKPRTSVKKNAAPAPPPPGRNSKPTDELPVLLTPDPRLTPTKVKTFNFANPITNGENGEKSPSSPVPKVIKIGETTPPPVQKPSKFRALFGLSSPTSPEPPKPKTRRIRVPKQKSPKGTPKPMPRTISFENGEKQKPVDKSPSPKAKSPKEENKMNHLSANNGQEKPLEFKQELNNSYDTPLTILPSKVSTLPDPPVRKAKNKADPGVTSQPKQLSFAENATVYSDNEEDLISMNSSLNNEKEILDSWDLVARHRANISQNATHVKAAAETRQKPTSAGAEVRVDFVPIDRPKTMREMRKSQTTGAGLNLKKQNPNLKENDLDSDTEA